MIMARPTRGEKPWRPYPTQIETLIAAQDGSSMGVIARKIGIPVTTVASRLSDCYDRLGIKEPETLAESQEHHLSQWRRYKAIKVCKANGWWPEEDVT